MRVTFAVKSTLGSPDQVSTGAKPLIADQTAIGSSKEFTLG
jgi:hypothetical protein